MAEVQIASAAGHVGGEPVGLAHVRVAEAQIMQQLEQLRETFVVLYGRPLGAAALVVGAFRDPPAVHAARRLVVHRPDVQLSARSLVRPDDGIV